VLKQAILIRDDLRMSVGKKCVQCCHASLGAYKKADEKVRKEWENEGEKKVVLKVSSRQELLNLYKKAREEKLPCFLVKDAGLTELKPGTITALGIGPETEEKIDRITGNIPLLK